VVVSFMVAAPFSLASVKDGIDVSRRYDLLVFATLLGGLPMPLGPGGSTLNLEAAIEAAIRAQEAAGLEPVTDGRLRTRDLLDLGDGLVGNAERPPAKGSIALAAWRAAAALTDRAVKQALPGPYTLGRRNASSRAGGSRRIDRARRRDRAAATMAYAEALRREVDALAVAGCPLVEIEELDAHLIGEDATERRLFRDAHHRITDGVNGTHLSLSIVGASVHTAGSATILGAPYHSLAVDLIAGPDNWYLVTAAPMDRGIVVGALAASDSPAEGPELLIWAANYAASTQSRSLIRVGIGTAGGLASLSWDAAVAKLNALGHAARLAALPPGDELADAVDPRSIDSRTAALGRRRGSPKAP
jgi:methionine synthase II (cobalamin-independent)